MAGTVAGWQLARETFAANNPREKLSPLEKLLVPAVDRANHGIEVTESLAAAAAKVSPELREFEPFQRIFTRSGMQLRAGDVFANTRMGALLAELGSEGLDGFYRGTVGQKIAAALQDSGSPLTPGDFAAYRAKVVKPLVANIRHGRVFNLPAPTKDLPHCFYSLSTTVLRKRTGRGRQHTRDHRMHETRLSIKGAVGCRSRSDAS